MPYQQSILLVAEEPSEAVLDLDLPSSKDNLFHRLIRNPHTQSEIPKERECTEMLAAVLINAPVVRNTLFTWMGVMTGLPSEILADDGCSVRIRTEQSIGAKRDDLRVEIFRQNEEGENLLVLWTVEVKVGASLHLSPLQESLDEVAIEAVEDVIQLVNYDNWLQEERCRNPSANISGFVLALDNMAPKIPLGLTSEWICITWTQIGQQLEKLLSDPSLAPEEKFLARHMAGFIRKHLWKDIEMNETKIDFDDIALIRAFKLLGNDCERKINDLVAPLAAVFENSVEGIGNVTHQKSMFKASARSVVYATFSGTPQPYIYAGIDGSKLRVWVESSRKDPSFKNLEQAIEDLLPVLMERNPNWVSSISDSSQSWAGLELSKPFHSILESEDQQSEVTDFVMRALENLKTSGFFIALKESLKV
jgi:hypothetical protein